MLLISEQYVQKRSKHKENRRDNRELEEKLLSPTTLVKSRAKVVTTKRTTEARSTLLEEDRNGENDGEDDLDVGQYAQYRINRIHVPVSVA